MKFIQTKIAGAYEIQLTAHKDARGRFKRHYCEREFSDAGLPAHFVQMNHSITVGRGTVRGLHYQVPPATEDKLVSCTVGRAFDVAVDVRSGSPTFLAWTAIELDEERMFYIPKGCAHGFQALTNELHLVYMHSNPYMPEFERGLLFDDPAINIDWPIAAKNVSDRDCSYSPIDSSFEGVKI
jgi:dTDP-4-dehydrorhamnose 3,5-epimerase